MRKTISVLLSVMIMLTVVFGCFAGSANAASTITYSFVISTPDAVNAFEGKIFYPSDSLSVNSVDFSGEYNDMGGSVYFNDSNIKTAFDFTDGKTMITVVFNVLGDYDASQLYGKISDIYSKDMVSGGNIPFDYSNVVDGEVISRGHTDIDAPSNSYADTKYSIVYSYSENPESETLSQYTKTAWAHSNDAKTIAEINMPNPQNPYFDNYSVESASFAANNAINATMSWENKKYSVSLNGIKQGDYEYLQTATLNVDEEQDFYINGNRVATGKAFSFFVTESINIITDDPSGEEIGDSAALISNALYISDNPNAQGNAYIKMELLASATSKNFSRMGVAFSSAIRSETDLKAAINEITSGTNKYNGIAVHNSKVDSANVSGQYQFIYAPYVSISKVNKDKSLYFYTFLVNSDNKITISEYQQVNFANVLA